MYGKLEDNKLFYAPVNYETDNNLIINFNKDINLMALYGYKEIVDIQPIYDNITECLRNLGYTETKDKIIANYEVEKCPQKQPTLEERTTSIEELLLSIL